MFTMRIMMETGLLAAFALLAAGCAAQESAPVSRTAAAGPDRAGTGKFVHCVFFTLKAGTPESEVESLIADGHKILAKVPTVRKIDTGRRDTRMNRDVNEKEYTVGLVVYFDDKAGHDQYNESELHTEYVNKHKEHWAKVVVYDFTAQ